MQHYKAPDNSVHAIDPEFEHFLPAGSVPITVEEAEVLRPKPPAPTVQEIIEAKKAMVRQLREQVLDRLAGIAGRASRKGDTVLAAVCDSASEQLLDITKDLPNDPAEVEIVMFARYQTIAATAIAAAPSLAKAFGDIDL